jgi:RHS repeat-associated protein
MVKWSAGSGTNEFYVYDAAGNRVLRRSTSGGVTTLTTYAFGTEEHTYSGTGTLQSSTYYYSLAGRLIAELSGTIPSTSILLTDALGSVLATFSNTVNSAALLGNQVYGPYGNQRYTSGTLGTNKGFTGQYSDTLTGLDYYNARYYDPVVGVFLSADTVQGNTKGMNPYAYVGGNPETWSDPTGHEAPCLENGCGEGASTGMPPDTGGGPSGSDIVTGILAFFIGVAIVFNGGHNTGPQNTQPQATPTPTETPTSGATPSTDTSGGMCRAGGCYNLTKDEGTSVYSYIPRKDGTWFRRPSTAHTIAEHVTISDADLRLKANRQGTASKFYSLDTAEWATQYALDHMTATEIAQLEALRGNPYNLGQTITIQSNTGVAIGYGYKRGNPNAIVDTAVRVVLMIGSGGNPFVLTSYPVQSLPTSSPSTEQRTGLPGNMR